MRHGQHELVFQHAGSQTRGIRAQVGMTPRVAGWRPKAGEEHPQFFRRTARWAEVVWESAGVAPRDAAVLARFLRLAGHLARMGHREPRHGVCVLVGWHDAWWRKAARGVPHSDAHRGRQGLNGGLRFLGKGRCGETLQKHPGTEVAQP